MGSSVISHAKKSLFFSKAPTACEYGNSYCQVINIYLKVKRFKMHKISESRMSANLTSILGFNI